MKKISICACLVLTISLLFATASIAKEESSTKTDSKTTATTASDSFMQSKDWNKVGANLQSAYTAAEKAGFPKQGRLTCFVRANENIRSGDKSFLTSNGFIVQIASGFTARGQMDIKDLPSVAALPFVQKIDTIK